MENIIKSNNIELKVRNKGAELFSILVDNEEFMWNKNIIWAKSSPILFPFIGALKDNKYKYKGKEYIIETKHGFARDKEFEILEKKSNKISYILKSNDETREIYPFDFNLIVNYEIIDNNKVKMEYVIENKTDGEMYFSIGYHPAFLLPQNYEDTYLQIDNKDEILSYKLDGVYIDYKDKLLLEKDSNKVYIKDKTFEIDTIILDGENSKKTELIFNNSSRKVTVYHENFEYLAYWKPQKANFICIEPWHGLPDFNNTDYNLENKIGIKKLDKNETFITSLTFKFDK
ncbi:aldose epimerase family protein [Oceanivirga salmonicida]|uniref:aldose epimerase family protein n=1 Tax=Oceanivirga salmonicida TaxID=1769291 RepID=UPI0012E2C61D|nr:aldose 1-epimerase family protein [Oceanivirga salmonicida]